MAQLIFHPYTVLCRSLLPRGMRQLQLNHLTATAGPTLCPKTLGGRGIPVRRSGIMPFAGAGAQEAHVGERDLH